MDLVTFELAKDWIPRLLGVLKSEKTAREGEISKIADIFGDPLQLAEHYIEPYCQQFNPADDDEDEERYIVREPIFSRLRHFLGGKTKSSGNQLFILADSGMGKSSILMMLKLGHLKQFWPPSLSCILLKLGDDTIREVEILPEKHRTILLLDALDEDPKAWGRINSRLQEILIATKHFSRVIITCRTQFFSAGEDPFNRRGKVEVSGFYCPVVYISLFTDQQVKDYLKNRFPNDEVKVNKALRLLLTMKSLRFRPMLLAHIEDLLDSESREWTEYSIYDALVKAWLDRECTKTLPDRKMPAINDLVNVCTDFAIYLFEKGAREMTEEYISTYADHHFRYLSKLDISGRSLLNKNSKGLFRFSHFSIQEFLVARSLIIANRFKKPRSLRSTDQLLRFLMSWFSAEEIGNRSRIKFSVLAFEKPEFSSTEMRGADFSDAQLKGVSFVESNLNSARFDRCIMDQGLLDRADMSNCSMISCSLQSASLEETNLVGANLQGSNLKSAKLLNTSLRETTLKGSDLTDATLTGADFEQADLQGTRFMRVSSKSTTNFNKANLDSAVFKGANLVSPTFLEAKLTTADLEGLKLPNVDFSHGNLREIKLANADLRNCKFAQADLTRGHFKESNLTGADLTGCNARGCSFSEAKMNNSIMLLGCFDGANFTGAQLKFAVLDGASFRGSRMNGIDFTRCKINSKSSFNSAELNFCSFGALDLVGVDFSEASLTNSDFRETRSEKVTFSKCSLNDALFSRAVLDFAIFLDASLIRADFSGASLRGAKLSGARVIGGQFENSNLEGAELFGTDLGQTDLKSAGLLGAKYDSRTIFPSEFEPEKFGLVFVNSEFSR